MTTPKNLASSYGSVGLTHVVHTQDTDTWYEVHHDVHADRARPSLERISSQTTTVLSRTSHHHYIVVPLAEAATIDHEEPATSLSGRVAKNQTAINDIVVYKYNPHDLPEHHFTPQ
ncbi:hypothetical protein ARMGADRAFT_1077807 [Armillaria gallica]|uniref:Uncharacterized protein n=1 Tax=Armillaria gallica TaxID=47427 RepID=A0A2H3E5V5_ARMGA|nr:hypothetical protein ARMGADRAFT_1077807 [Armillaria gallica]